MDGISPQRCAQMAVQKITTLALEIRAPHKDMKCRWQLTFQWQKVIQHVIDIHKWSIEGQSGEMFEEAENTVEELNMVLKELKLTTFTDKLRFQKLGKLLKGKALIFDKAVSGFGLKAEDQDGTELAEKLSVDWKAAMDPVTGCANSLAVPDSE